MQQCVCKRIPFSERKSEIRRRPEPHSGLQVGHRGVRETVNPKGNRPRIRNTLGRSNDVQKRWEEMFIAVLRSSDKVESTRIQTIDPSSHFFCLGVPRAHATVPLVPHAGRQQWVLPGVLTGGLVLEGSRRRRPASLKTERREVKRTEPNIDVQKTGRQGTRGDVDRRAGPVVVCPETRQAPASFQDGRPVLRHLSCANTVVGLHLGFAF